MKGLHPLIAHLSSAIQARANCAQSGNTEWLNRHSATIDAIAKELPSGSGIDNGTRVDLDRSTADKIVLTTSFHHMNDGGYYDGWTDHTITVTPTFTGIALRISGRDRNQIKEYLYQTFDHALTTEYEEIYDATTERSTFQQADRLRRVR